MRPLAALALVAVLGGCGGGDATATSVLARTADELAEVRSGRLDVSLVAKAGNGKGFGFTLAGPFAFEEGRPLPVLDVTYVQTAGDRSASTKVVSTGTAAYVVAGGTAYRLPESALGSEKPSSALGGLRIDRWLVEPVLEEGAETDTIRARLDPVNALNDVAALAGSFGQSAAIPRVEGEDAERLRTTAKNSTVVVTTGHDDRLLRTVSLTVTLEAVSSLPEPLRGLAPVTLTMTLTLSDPNRPVSVSPPATSRPYADLPRNLSGSPGTP